MKLKPWHLIPMMLVGSARLFAAQPPVCQSGELCVRPNITPTYQIWQTSASITYQIDLAPFGAQTAAVSIRTCELIVPASYTDLLVRPANLTLCQTTALGNASSFMTALVTGLNPNRVYVSQLIFTVGSQSTIPLPFAPQEKNESAPVPDNPVYSTMPGGLEGFAVPGATTDSQFLAILSPGTTITSGWSDAYNPLGNSPSSLPGFYETPLLNGSTTRIEATHYDVQICDYDLNNKFALNCLPSRGLRKSGFITQANFGGLQHNHHYELRVRVINIAATSPEQRIVSGGHGNYLYLGHIETPPNNNINYQFIQQGYPLDRVQVCVPQAQPIFLQFDRSMRTFGSGRCPVSAERNAGPGGSKNIQPLPISCNWIENPNPSDDSRVRDTLKIEPVSGSWPDGSVKLTLQLSQFIDFAGRTLGSDKQITYFQTRPDHTQEQIITPFYDLSDESISLKVPANSVAVDECLVIRTQFIQPQELTVSPSPISVRAADMRAPENYFQIGKRVEVVKLKNFIPVQTNFNPMLTLDYKPTALTKTFRWSRLGNQALSLISTIQTAQNSLETSEVDQTGVYVLLTNIPPTELDQLSIYPIPYRSDMNVPGITFKNLGDESRITIHNIAGERIFQHQLPSGDTLYLWPVINNNGEKLASGIYFYTVQTTTAKKSGKLIVIK